MARVERIVRLYDTVRDACGTHASLPFFRASRGRIIVACAALFIAATSRIAGAQNPRPWLDWRTTTTQHFVIHYPSTYRVWARALAERLEGVRAQVERVVGFVPAGKVNIVIDDPSNDANGTAFTPLGEPTIVLWPTPPDPREEIGNFLQWDELVATHEFAHVAHLTRPSRNRWTSFLWSLSPVPLSPIAANAPRWVIEGYATYVEGLVTGSGRPNHAYRAAMLRQFALEGRLPSYGQLNGGPWIYGSFAYLAGSAFFEWLARREGDASVTALWRRMTAKTNRSFDEAFAGVYGGGPAQLYGRFAAEVTADAIAFERSASRDSLVTGALVQRLFRGTGDPAISPDGRFIALTVRHQDAPSQLVVWRTADEVDTAYASRRALQRRRDPDDVPDRAFYPAPKHIVVSLIADDGAAYETPRWLPDNKRLLVSRRLPLANGTIRSDFFLWSAEDGTLSRLTKGAGLRDGDPSPDGRWAAATRCDRGWCDLVRVDLRTGDIRLIRAGSVSRNYFRPRVSRKTGEVVVAEQSGDRWRIARVNPETGELTYADPDDGVTRYDATYDTDGRTIITTSELGGIADLERLGATEPTATTLTAVTGAAIAADVAPDGTLWFLSLSANGYDLRRIRPDVASITRTRAAAARPILPLVDSLSPVLPPRRIVAATDSSRRPVAGRTSEEAPYGIGPSRFRYLPTATTGYGGSSLQLSLLRSDPVGRFGVGATASFGAGTAPEGFGMTVTSRQSQNVVIASGWTSHEHASREFDDARAQGLDVSRSGGAVRLQRFIASDGAEYVVTLGGLVERQIAESLDPLTRGAGIATASAVWRQRDEDTRYQEELRMLGEAGATVGGSYLRQRMSLLIGTGAGTRPLSTLQASYGTVGGSTGALRERFVLGGFASPLIDPVLDARRVDAPAYPAGVGATMNFSAFRAAIPYQPFEIFYSSASPDLYTTSFRSYGLEVRERIAAIPALGTPDVSVLAGFARALDAPVAGEWRYYLSVSVRP